MERIKQNTVAVDVVPASEALRPIADAFAQSTVLENAIRRARRVQRHARQLAPGALLPAAAADLIGRWARLPNQLSELDPKERRLLAGALARAERILSQAAIGSRPEPIIARVKRNWRLISITLLVLLLGGLGALKLARMGLRPNLALHRPVQTSSVYGDFSNGERLVDSDPSNIGFHTQLEANPYAIIDLGRSMRIDEIVVHNRADCCQERAIPLVIEVSDDGRQVAERTKRFDRWNAKNSHAHGRYVRLKVKAVTSFHLNEVEIF